MSIYQNHEKFDKKLYETLLSQRKNLKIETQEKTKTTNHQTMTFCTLRSIDPHKKEKN